MMHSETMRKLLLMLYLETKLNRINDKVFQKKFYYKIIIEDLRIINKESLLSNYQRETTA
jgi:hypothetical protein